VISATYHGFPANRLDERIENLRKSVRGDLRSPDAGRILIHAFIPVVADRLERRKPHARIAAVLAVRFRASGHFHHNIRHGLVGFLVNVALHRGPEAVDHVDASAEQEDVEDELCVEGEDVRDRRVLRDEGEHRTQPVRFVFVLGALVAAAFASGDVAVILSV
jgi:hypothetical protein